ncbi:hypothetical protein [Mesorhizobium sp. M7A.F.Ca.US.001.02.1.1]|uniref:hypothetical protein n=1 Tax=Mesorhizobium sp. M7A.F.Ca.US.001.02.1.1 TaxID=2496703 RepID=UPI0013E30BAF|nr:hypothetical protein [Mesorhizobium sp. M7A.F.Ca.US.001.02.1.1]
MTLIKDKGVDEGAVRRLYPDGIASVIHRMFLSNLLSDHFPSYHPRPLDRSIRGRD